MKRFVISVISILACVLSMSARSTVNVLACEPEWAALAQAVGGDRVKVTSATTPLQDPHRIEARPSLIARARNADLLVCSGLDLEIGWLPILLQQSANPKIAPGQPGYFEAGPLVPRIELPARVDRSEGDVHPGGNPHVHLDPLQRVYLPAIDFCDVFEVNGKVVHVKISTLLPPANMACR